MSVSLASLCGERWSRSVRREDAKTEERACAQTSRVSLTRECRDVSASRLCFSAYRSIPRPACCGLFTFCKDFNLRSITKDRIQSYLKK